MTTSDMRQRYLDFRRRLYEEHDLSTVEEIIHPEFTSHNPLGPGKGVAAYKSFVQNTFFTGVPDLLPVTQQIVVEGEQLMAMTQWQATHTGSFLGVAPTGKTLHFQTADLYRIEDGLLREHWDVVDRLDASLALGLIRPSA
jgi:predicted ester cyclase